MPTAVVPRTAHRFVAAMRLDSAGVSHLLRNGSVVRAGQPAIISARLLARSPGGYARLAIAVPKRILNSAVDRNHVKRAIRECFRRHDLRFLPVDLLVSLISKMDTHDVRAKQALLDNIERVFDRISERVRQVAP